MTELVLHQSATIQAGGTHINGNSKAVTILEEGKTFGSVTDAAEYLGVHYSMLQGHLHGKYRTVKGKHCFFVSQRDSNYDAMANHINNLYEKQSELERKAALWDAYEAEQNAARKAKEAHEAAVAKAMEKVARRQRIYEATMEKAKACNIRLAEAKRELEALNGSVISA